MDNKRILAQGISVSNDTRATGLNNNDLIIGSSGSGKTGGYVIPNLQNISGSIVVSDTKGQLCRMFGRELRAKGYNVRTVDMVNPANSCGYNPLRGIRKYADGKYREQDVLTIANIIMPTRDSHEPFWEKAAAGYIAFLIAFCMDFLPPEEQNMLTVCDLHDKYISHSGELMFTKAVKDRPDTFAARKYRQITGTAGSDKMWSSILEFANRALEPYTFNEAKHIFGNPDSFDIADLGRKKTVLFLNVSDTDRTFDHIVTIFHTQALQILCSEADANPDGRLKVPVRLIMDDFATSAKLPDFDKTISVIRSREISVSIILQSLTQLETLYSHAEAVTIINNCDHLLYLGCQEPETAQFIGYRVSKTPSTVLNMPRDSMILVTNGEQAQTVKKIVPYSTMKKRAADPELSF